MCSSRLARPAGSSAVVYHRSSRGTLLPGDTRRGAGTYSGALAITSGEGPFECAGGDALLRLESCSAGASGEGTAAGSVSGGVDSGPCGGGDCAATGVLGPGYVVAAVGPIPVPGYTPRFGAPHEGSLCTGGSGATAGKAWGAAVCTAVRPLGGGG